MATLRRLSLVAVGGAAAALSHCSSVARPDASPLYLASTLVRPVYPTTVLVHGLDSSKETWRGVLSELADAGLPAIALDLRGHGESPLGPPANFSLEALARDVLATAEAMGLSRPFVLVGHSMGGRVAIQAAAMDAEQVEKGGRPMIAACVIEDMDLAPRKPSADLTDEEQSALQAFASPDGRRFRTWEACKAALLPWYATKSDPRGDRVESWRGTRVRALPHDGGWWSDINPLAMRLARQHVLVSDEASHAWDGLAKSRPTLSVHLWVAGDGSVCKWRGAGGIHDMVRRFPASKVKKFEEAGHSIHNTARRPFMDSLISIIEAEASRDSQ